ncbi:MAG: hypothetical protein Q8L26_09400 [Candidatus Omnitrophota bacterium]|nr:hypothetical protein [Candidatus Omnitrophota bacterium]
MKKAIKIFSMALFFLNIAASCVFAYDNNNIYFQKNSNYADAPSYAIDSDTLYMDLWDNVAPGYGGVCYCSVPNASVTITATGGSMTTNDSLTLTLVSYSGSYGAYDTEKWRNASAVSIVRATSASATTGNSTLEVEDGQTLSVSFRCGSLFTGYGNTAYDANDTATDTATVSVGADSTRAITLSNTASYPTISAFDPATMSTLYIRLKDTGLNKKGYTQETENITVVSGAGDSVTLSNVQETGNNTGIFETNVTVTTNTVNTGNSQLEISSTGDTITATSATNSVTASLGANAVASGFTVSASSPQTAGTPFALTITAKDANGNTVTTYSGTATLTTNYVSPGSGSYTISPTSTSSFTSGVATVNVTYADAGIITITATDTNSKTGTSNQILLLPANFLVESTGGTSQVVGKAFNLKVTARNSSNNTTPNYNREVNLTASNVTPTGTSPTISPTSITGSSFSSGAKTVSLTYNKWGTAKITATDSGYSTVTGTTSSAVNFYPNSFSIDVAAPAASRSKFYLEEPFDITVKALDYSDNVIVNYAGTVTFPAVSDVDVPDDYTFLSSDSGQHAFSLSCDKEKTFKLKVNDKTYTSATGESSDISLMYGKIKVNDASGKIGTINTTVEIVDKKGKVIASDDSTTFVVILSESKNNNTATASSADLTVSGGTVAISVTDTELESVTVTPDSTPYLEPESGTVTFSETAVGGGGARRIGSGARVLWWRELRSDEAK